LSIDYGHLQGCKQQKTMKSSPLTSFVRDDLHLVSSTDRPIDEAMLRKRIGELQQYRKLGLTTAADIKKSEEDLYKRVRFAYLTLPCFIFTTHHSWRAFRLRQKQICHGTTFLRSDCNNSGPPAHASLLVPTHGGTAVLRGIARASTKQVPRGHRAADPVRVIEL
jgi:hypothetical protein